MFSRLFNPLLDLFLPTRCLICGRFDSWWCLVCQRKALIPQNPRCIVCNKASITGAAHADCRTRNTVDGLLAAGEFWQLKDLVHTYKYEFVQGLAPLLADLISRFLVVRKLEEFVSGSILVPVPLHKKRLRFRGFNQSELLTLEISKLSGSKIALGAIERKRYTTPQIELARENRMKNITDAFVCVKPDIVKNQRVILIDDVATTGATLNECARVLKRAGATTVWALVLAHD